MFGREALQVSMQSLASRGTGPRATVAGHLPVGETSGLDVPVARGPVPRERWMARTMARDRVSQRPTMKGYGFDNRSAGACPPRVSGRPQHGEGQAPALRCGGGVLFRSAGPVPRARQACSSRSPDLDPFGSGRSRTTVVGPMRPPLKGDKFMKHPQIRCCY